MNDNTGDVRRDAPVDTDDYLAEEIYAAREEREAAAVERVGADLGS